MGGGRIHGPTPRDHAYRLPKKVRRVALRSALSDRAAAERVVVIEDIEPAEIKTRAVHDVLKKLDLAERKVLIITDSLSEKLALSVRNIPNVVALAAREVNTYTVIASEYVVVTRAGLAALEEVFG